MTATASATAGENAAAPSFVSSSTDNPSSPPRPTEFHCYASLNDDIALSILSFVADAPFESGGLRCRSALTHTLPLVSKHMHDLVAATDVFWRNALERLLRKEPFLWGEGLRSVIDDYRVIDLTTDEGAGERHYAGTDGSCSAATLNESSSSERETKTEHSSDLIDEAARAMEHLSGPRPTASTAQRTTIGACQRVFRAIVSNHIRFTSPVFYMPGSAFLGQEFGLHFFEPRYRLLISEVMGPYPVSCRRGEPIALDGARVRRFPRFIYANHAPLVPSVPACIVEVRQCLIHPNGTADVFLVPTAHVWLESMWERPLSGNLIEARAVRMTKEASRSVERERETRGIYASRQEQQEATPHSFFNDLAARDIDWDTGFYEHMEGLDEEEDQQNDIAVD